MHFLPFFGAVKPVPGELVLGRVVNSPFALYRVPAQARSRHFYCCGISGTGKSKALEMMLAQDAANGIPFTLIDPHGDLARDLVKHLITQGTLSNQAIRERIVYIDPTITGGGVIPMNLLATEDQDHVVAESIVEAFKRAFPEALAVSPSFNSIIKHSLLALIKTRRTLVDLPRLLTNQDYRDRVVQEAADPKLTEFFHDLYDQFGAHESLNKSWSTLNKVHHFTLNPHLFLMLGQKENVLDFRSVMDNRTTLIINIGGFGDEPRKLFGGLVMTALEIAMRRRKTRHFYSVVVDEFADFLANQGSTQTLSSLFSQSRKFGLGLTVAHQTLGQLTPEMREALGNTATKLIFGVDRHNADWLAKLVGRIDPTSTKPDPNDAGRATYKTDGEQYREWADYLADQKPRQATVRGLDHRTTHITTLPIPAYTATEDQVDAFCQESLARWGIPYAQAQRNIAQSQAGLADGDISLVERLAH